LLRLRSILPLREKVSPVLYNRKIRLGCCGLVVPFTWKFAAREWLLASNFENRIWALAGRTQVDLDPDLSCII
jgi:hypothetical protein